MSVPQRIFSRIGSALAVSVALSCAPIDAASAQGFFEQLFGTRPRPAAPAAPQVNSFADPLETRQDDEDRPRRGGGGGTYASYCVRLCDGRFFPLGRGAANPAQLCQSFCPAAKTKVFTGCGIDNASASDGARYDDLDNAFVYRDKVVENCTCNGKTPMGLARLDAKADPTLKPGDIVATAEGLMAYQGGGKRNAEFTPIDRSILSKEWRTRLSAIQVAPAQEQAPSDADLPSSEKFRGRASR